MDVPTTLAAYAREEIGGDPEDISDWERVAEALHIELVTAHATVRACAEACATYLNLELKERD